MSNKLFVGGIPYSTTDDELKAFFEECGPVKSARIIMDRDTNRSKGFGFVEMETEEDAKKAIEQKHDQELGGRRLMVNEARPRD